MAHFSHLQNDVSLSVGLLLDLFYYCRLLFCITLHGVQNKFKKLIFVGFE